MKFSELGLSEEVLKAIDEAGYQTPTPIQQQAIPLVLRQRDILACAQTGTGKTASFTLPMIDILASGQAKSLMPRSLILEPTRELAAQVADNFEVYGKYNKLTKALLIGGASMDQQKQVLARGVDVLIATPGRLIDMFERGGLLLNDVKILVIDEADRMLDMGFIPDVDRIVSLIPTIRQTLFFSATLPPAIMSLAQRFLINPKEITVAPPATPAATVTQGLLWIKSARGEANINKQKRATLRELLSRVEVKNALIFCNRKRDVGVVHRSLVRHGFNAGQLHGDMSQPARTETLGKFKANEVSLLVCSDVAARGLDISNLSHVFNYDVPSHAEDYVHRIGRTGRAGKTGEAYTLATIEDKKYLAAIESLIGKAIPPIEGGTEPSDGETEEKRESGERSRKPSRGRSRRGESKVEAKADAKVEVETKVEAKVEAKIEEDEAARRRKPTAERGRRKERPEDREPSEPVKGLGEHVPAFLQRPVPLPSK